MPSILLEAVLVFLKGSAVTSQKDIQSLIADIDSILPNVGSRLPWSKPSEATRSRQVLERVRRYLVSLQHNSIPQNLPTPTLPTQQSAVQQIVQAVTQEIDGLRNDLTKPLQAELAVLREQRESLIKEIRQLQDTRQESVDRLTQQKAAQEQIMSEFAQDLINRSTERLTQQLAQMVVNLEAQLLNNPSATGIKSDQGSVTMLPQQRLEQLRQLQMQFDQMLMALDANHQVIFEALQRNLHSYHESLSQGLETMHRLGLQGEMLFTALVNRLAQQLGREASTMLPPSIPPASTQAPPDRQLPQEVLRETAYRTPGSLEVTPQPLTPPSQLFSDIPRSVHPQDSTLNPEEINQATGANPAQSDLTPEEIVLENLSSQDWEPIEGLDLEDDSDRIDTFIQLEIEPQESFPTIQDIDITDSSESQELDLLFGGGEETWTEISSFPRSQAKPPEGINPLPSSGESFRQDIDELYESLFGRDALSSSVKSDESEIFSKAESERMEPLEMGTETQTPTDTQPEPLDSIADTQTSMDTQADPLDSIAVGSEGIEEFLFEGLSDPARETTSTASSVDAEEPLTESWEALLFEESGSDSSRQGDLLPVEQRLTSPFQQQQSNQEDSVETISALTDLLDQMGLSYSLPTQGSSSTLAIAEDAISETTTRDSESQTSSVEDRYIPASPDEDLLAIDELTTDGEPQIELDQTILEQLSQDLHSFEDYDPQDTLPYEEPPFPDQDWRSPPIPPIPNPQVTFPQHRVLPMSEELLAEDWEEFALQDLSQGDAMFPRWEGGTSELSPQDANQDTSNPEDWESPEDEISHPLTSTTLESELVADEVSDDTLDSEPGH
ncbi:MAG TPA: hypothetical protein DD379_12275 [Cyanobacteria bacterium UBA11162]|nr:hypothetical protein [Cyanobacteria bacterium UBA11162]